MPLRRHVHHWIIDAADKRGPGVPLSGHCVQGHCREVRTFDPFSSEDQRWENNGAMFSNYEGDKFPPVAEINTVDW